MDIVDIYLECGNFQEAVRRSGLPAYVAHIKLIDANRLYRTNNPGFDFEYKGLTIDVKYSSLRRKSKSPHRQWSVRCKGDRDFIVAFLEREPNSELNEPMILIIPYGMLSFEAEDTLHFFESSEIFKTYQVLPEQLVEILEDYASLKEQGLI